MFGPARARVLAFEAMAWGRPIVSLALAVLFGAAACSTLSGAPLGKGDRVFTDVDATTLPPQPSQTLPPDSAFAPVEGSVSYGPAYDASAVLSICGAEAGASKGKTDSAAPSAGPKSGPASGEDAGGGDDAAPVEDAATTSDVSSYPSGTGSSAACEAMPAACANEPDCECLFRALAAKIPCSYPHCSAVDGFQIYCP